MADGQHSKKLVMLGLTVGLLAYARRASKAFLEVVFVFLRVLSVFLVEYNSKVFYGVIEVGVLLGYNRLACVRCKVLMGAGDGCD